MYLHMGHMRFLDSAYASLGMTILSVIRLRFARNDKSGAYPVIPSVVEGSHNRHNKLSSRA